MNIPEGIVAFLSPEVDIFPGIIPEQWDRPAATFRLISYTEPLDHDGPTGLISERYQISAYAETYEDALAMIRTIRDLFRGIATGGNLGAGALVDIVEVANMTDLGFALEAGSHGISIDVNLSYVEV